MLTLIERVIFLKEVPFFRELSIQDLRILASISEESSYPAGHKIFARGDTTKTLYVIIKGKVSAQVELQPGKVIRFALLEPKQYFAETSIFDGNSHQADIVVVEDAEILLIRQSSLFALIRRQPEIGLILLKALSERLRQAYADLARNAHSQPVRSENPDAT